MLIAELLGVAAPGAVFASAILEAATGGAIGTLIGARVEKAATKWRRT